MARMYDTSGLPGSFGLDKLSITYHKDVLEIREKYIEMFKDQFSKNNQTEKIKMLETYKSFNSGNVKKTDMKTLFSYKKLLKDGTEGKTSIMPEIEELHTNPKYYTDWVKYSVIDAEVVFYLRDVFQRYLQSLTTQSLTHFNPVSSRVKNNYEFYLNYWREFGELLTDMEREGIKIDISYLQVRFKLFYFKKQKIQIQAETDLKLHENKFLDWVHSVDYELRGFNPGSTQQIQQLFFGPCYKKVNAKNKHKYAKQIQNKADSENQELYDDEVEKNSEDDNYENEEINFSSEDEEVINNNKISSNHKSSISNKSKIMKIQNKGFGAKNSKEDNIIEVIPEVRVFKIDNLDVSYFKFNFF